MNRIKFHVKKGDQVEVISGNFQGSTGKILDVIPSKQRVLIEGVRIIKKHLRKSQDNPQRQDRRAGGTDSHFECEIDRTREEGREESGKGKEAEERNGKGRGIDGERILSPLQGPGDAGACERSTDTKTRTRFRESRRW